MSGPGLLEIKVVYDSSRRGRRGAVVRPGSARPGRRGGAAWIWRGASLLVAALMYWAVWWQVDPFLYITMIKKTPIDMPEGVGASGFFVASRQPALGELPIAGPDEQVGPPALWSGKTAQVVIPLAAYGWLTLAMAGVCTVALAGGAGVGSAQGGLTIRWIGAVVAAAALAGLALAAVKVWSQYGMKYAPNDLRWGMGWLAMVFALAGPAAAAWARRLTRIAAWTVLAAAAASALGMWLWGRCGALEAGQASVTIMALVFTVHSGWGWVMWVMTRRM